jgi:hypothetical protein
MIQAARNGEGRFSPVIEVSHTTDSAELATAREQHERFQRNLDWLEAHADEVYRHRGKHVCIAGQELFVADTAPEALALAKAAHPDDDGRYLRFIPKERLPRIYANRWHLAPV